MVVINNIGDYIKSVRKEKKITSRKLAELSQVSQAYISQLETGKHSSPSPEVLEKIATALDIPHFDLMKEAGYLKEDEIDVLLTKRQALSEDFMRKKKNVTPLAEEYRSLKSENHLLELEIKDNFFSITDPLTEEEKTLLIQKNKDLVEKNKLRMNDISVELNNFMDETGLFNIEINQINNSVRETLERQRLNSNIQKVELENLFSGIQEITIDGKLLTEEEKQKALQILKLTFK